MISRWVRVSTVPTTSHSSNGRMRSVELGQVLGDWEREVRKRLLGSLVFYWLAWCGLKTLCSFEFSVTRWCINRKQLDECRELCQLLYVQSDNLKLEPENLWNTTEDPRTFIGCCKIILSKIFTIYSPLFWSTFQAAYVIFFTGIPDERNHSRLRKELNPIYNWSVYFRILRYQLISGLS